MKKILIRIAVVVVVLIVVAGVSAILFLDHIVKKGVETAGPMVTKVDVKLDKASISLLGGSAHLKGLFVGNPPGCKTDSAIKVGEVSVSLKPLSVLSDKIVVESVKVVSPEITIEGGIKDNNLTKILDNVTAAAGGSGATEKKDEKASSTKIQVTDLTITGAKVHSNTLLSGGKTVTVTLPDIRLTNLGTGSDGITPAELTKRVMDELMGKVIPALTEGVAQIGKEALELGKGATEEAKKGVEKVTGGLKGLLKR
jgi:hypothetical protein